MNTKAKAASRSLTPKQADIKAASLIRGIDNSVARIKKEAASIADAAKQLKKSVLPALSNPKAKASAKIPAKKASVRIPAKKASAKASAKKASAKASAKKAPAKASAKKAPAQSPSKAAQKAKPPVKGRPTIKEAIQETIRTSDGSSPAELWKKVVGRYGYWSRQSLYNALKDVKLFKKVGGKIELLPEPTSGGRGHDSGEKDDGIDDFVDGVVADKSVARAV